VLPLRKDLADLFCKWLDRHPDLRPDEPLLDIRNKGTAYMLRKDLKRARKAWIEAAETPKEQKARSQSAFLSYVDDRGRVVDFHALRKTFITNLCLAGVSPKAAQVLARHCDINLTMNVYTMLSVQEQALAIEALPPIPQQRKKNKDSAGGKDEVRRAS
jgi:integrase